MKYLFIALFLIGCDSFTTKKNKIMFESLTLCQDICRAKAKLYVSFISDEDGLDKCECDGDNPPCK